MLVAPALRRVAIVASTRLPFARSQGAYATDGNQDVVYILELVENLEANCALTEHDIHVVIGRNED